MSMLPHHPGFPFRRQIVIAAVGAGALVAVCWPGLDLARRIAAPCAVVLSAAITFGVVLGMLRLLGHFPRVIFLAYSYTFFYGGVLGLLLSPFILPFAVSDVSLSSEFERAMIVSSFIPIGLAASAAAYMAIDSERNAAQQAAAGDARNARA
jgi:hypothetical protein